jgi:hypothetical protein
MGSMPSSHVDLNSLKLLRDIRLVDEEFNIPGRVDMLIRSDLFAYLMKSGLYPCGKNYPVVQETHLGWLLRRIPKEGICVTATLFLSNEGTLDFILQIFWEQDEIIFTTCTKEQQVAEQHFVETTTRDETGFFIIRLPRHVDHPSLRNSYTTAECTFQQLGIKLTINIELHIYS